MEKQIVNFKDDVKIQFSKGEKIYVESSYKYTVKKLSNLALESGFLIKKCWKFNTLVLMIFASSDIKK